MDIREYKEKYPDFGNALKNRPIIIKTPTIIDKLADQIVKEMPLRANEDIDQWAENLANDVCLLED